LMDAEVGAEQVEWLVVELGQEFAPAAVSVFLRDIVVTSDATAEAGLRLDVIFALDVGAEQPLRKIVALWAEVVDRHGVEFLQHVVGRPGATATATTQGLDAGRSAAFDDVDIDLLHRFADFTD